MFLIHQSFIFYYIFITLIEKLFLCGHNIVRRKVSHFNWTISAISFKDKIWRILLWNEFIKEFSLSQVGDWREINLVVLTGYLGRTIFNKISLSSLLSRQKLDRNSIIASYIWKNRRKERAQMETRAFERRQRLLKSCAATLVWQLWLPRDLAVGPGHWSHQDTKSAAAALLIKGGWTRPYTCVMVSFLAFVFILSISVDCFLSGIFKATITLGGLDSASYTMHTEHTQPPCSPGGCGSTAAVVLSPWTLAPESNLVSSQDTWLWNDSVAHRSQ